MTPLIFGIILRESHCYKHLENFVIENKKAWNICLLFAFGLDKSRLFLIFWSYIFLTLQTWKWHRDIFIPLSSSPKSLSRLVFHLLNLPIFIQTRKCNLKSFLETFTKKVWCWENLSYIWTLYCSFMIT